ncbi:MAG TPA: FHA domain-containing protein [Thermoleophilaceae bacterium]|jgi:pSer/pThr/pTyr-binding forkhead associated (FHA) protein|nr:FHA domain-containing protein [Thermoleophilaceae bacterium]
MTRAVELKARIDAERKGLPFLVYRDGQGGQHIQELSEPELTVGRRDENDVALSWDAEVSRLHAELHHMRGDWTVSDDGLSRNGTFVNGERIRGRRRLRDGDRLCFGETVVVFHCPAESDSQSTLAVPGSKPDVHLSETQRNVLAALCRPVNESAFATPATNRAIAEQLFLSVDAVKAHLRVLFERFELGDLPQNQKRASLAATALLHGIVDPRDL